MRRTQPPASATGPIGAIDERPEHSRDPVHARHHRGSGAGPADHARGFYPENSFELFGPVIEWVESYLLGSSAPLNLELLYLNTSSIKSMMDIFDVLEAAHGKGRQVGVTWFYDMRNERVGELAEEFKEDCTFPFSVIGRQ